MRIREPENFKLSLFLLNMSELRLELGMGIASPANGEISLKTPSFFDGSRKDSTQFYC
jgi:hypothetical protein